MCDYQNKGIDAAYATASSAKPPGLDLKEVKLTIIQRLENRRARTAQKLAKIDLALQVLYQNPQAKEIFDVIEEARQY